MSAAPCVWLHATTPDEAAVVQVLAAQLATARHPPRVHLTGFAGAPDPGDQIDVLDALIDAQGIRLLVLVGSVLPVVLIERAKARGLGLMLVNARDPAPRGGWRILPGYTSAILRRFDQIHADSAAAAAAIRKSTREAGRVLETGPLAGFPPVRGCNQQELDALRTAVGARPVWFAHNLPQVEWPAVLRAQAQALRRAHRLLLIVQPRELAAGDSLLAEAEAAALTVAQRSHEAEITETTQVYVADTDDDAGLFLRLAPISYLGGSLTEGAGTPPVMTAAALGSALIFGPQAEGAAQAHLDALRSRGAGRLIGSAEELGEAVSHLLVPEVGADLALRAWGLASDGAEATLTVANAICDWLAVTGATR